MHKNYLAVLIFSVWVSQLFICPKANAQTYTISTIAGNGTAGFSGDTIAATTAELNAPSNVSIDASGNIYIGDASNNRIRKVNKSGIITTVAGNGTGGYSGDGGKAILAELNNAEAATTDYAGNLYLADEYNQRVREVTPGGAIFTFAGNGHLSFSGDGGQATAAQLFFPLGIARDQSGNIYIADCFNHRIRKINVSGVISTIAGTGKAGFAGDNGQATNAELNFPNGVAVDASGNIYIADANNNRIRKINGSGIISTIAGDGWGAFWGDGGQATGAALNDPTGVAVDASGNVYIADRNNNRIREVNTGGIISTVGGNGTAGFYGDGGPATAAELNSPYGIAVDGFYDLFVSDNNNQRIRKIVGTGTISTYAGNGTQGYFGDGGVATSAEINTPYGVWVDAAGSVFISDAGNNRIREVNVNGIISTVAGSGTAGFAGDGSAATLAKLNVPVGITVDASGNIYFVDEFNQRVRKVNTNGIISTIAGNGNLSYSGDGGMADSAEIFFPTSIARDASGNTFIADCFNHRIRKVNAGGIISTVAGNGTWGYNGDGGQATASELFFPTCVVTDASGNMYIADAGNNRVRKININGVISTVAGNGKAGYYGDGSAATAAELNNPAGVALDGFGNLYIADKNNSVIRKVNNKGIISTVAGDGVAGFYGDGGPALAAQLNNPWGLTVDATGDIYIADYKNNRVRELKPNCLLTDSITSETNVTCVGAHDGSATVSVISGGTPPYHYAWYPSGGTSATASNLSAGTYTVNIIDTNGCLGSASVTINRPPYIINTVVGTGTGGYGGDGNAATAAEIYFPVQIALDASGNLYIADYSNNRIREVNTNGIISTIAGSGVPGYSGDGGPATSAKIEVSPGVGVNAAGTNVYIADQDTNHIRLVTGGNIYNFAGTGVAGYSGDGNQATLAEIYQPADIAVDSKGNVYFVDGANLCVRKVNTNGIISTYAGNTYPGYSGDGGPATAAKLNYPVSLSIDANNNLYIADRGNNCIRKVTPGDTIFTIAGNGNPGYSGDGGPATAAKLTGPWKAVADAQGNVYIADAGNECIRMVDKNGIISTIAGNGKIGFSGDGGLALKAEFNNPIGLAVDASGNIYVSDNGNQRIRELYACPICTLKASATALSKATCDSNIGSLSGANQLGVPPYTYSWSPAGGSGNVAKNLSAGTYTLTVTDSLGCIATATATVMLSKNLAATVSSNPDSVCAGDNATITASGGGSYIWSNGGTGAQITVNPKTSTTYTVIVSSGSCSDSLSITVFVHKIKASISGPDSICPGDAITLTASGGNNFIWSTGSTNASITVSNLGDSTYHVVVYSGSCYDSASHTVIVATDGTVCSLKFYNGFTPNGDGHNDSWQIDNLDLFPNNDVRIFNRWGILVWKGDGYNNSTVVWSGEDEQGKPLPDATYYYVVKVNSKTYKGWVQLTR